MAHDFGNRWQVVTIDGNLVELSGAMQGGGKTVRRGGMQFTNINSATTTTNPLLDGSKEECAKLEAHAGKSLHDLKQYSSASCDTTRVELTKCLPDLRANCLLNDDDAAKLTKLNRKIQKCTSDMASCAMLASKLEADVARLQKSILDAGGSRLKKQ
eukprot:scaffold536_cov142-Chaetoceros_neogracile.AAC.6